MSKYRTAYAPEFRQQFTELVHAGRSANNVAKEFGLHATTVAKWVRLSSMGMPAAVPLPKSNMQQAPALGLLPSLIAPKTNRPQTPSRAGALR